MSVSRRSFLAAVLGAVAAPAVKPGVNLHPAEWPASWAETGDVVWPYMVWDSATILPGQVLNERLFPPPGPRDFEVTSMGFRVPLDVPYKNLEPVVESVRLRFNNCDLALIECPLFSVVYGAGTTFRLVSPVFFGAGDELGLYLDSWNEPVDCTESVTISVVLQGLARLPASVKRLSTNESMSSGDV